MPNPFFHVEMGTLQFANIVHNNEKEESDKNVKKRRMFCITNFSFHYEHCIFNITFPTSLLLNLDRSVTVWRKFESGE